MPDSTSTTEKGRTPLNDKFERLVNQTLKTWEVPGLSVAVIDGDETYAKGYGLATLPDIPVTPSTLFYAGSTTKAFTSAAASLLVDDDQKFPGVKWTTPLSDIIRDDFVLQDEYWTKHITIEDALCHRTSMPRHEKSYGGDRATAKGIVRSLRHLPLMKHPPRTHWEYCNTMYVAVSHAIETLTGMALGELFRDKIWEPLEMHSTFSSVEDAKASSIPLASGYRWDREAEKYVEVPYMDLAVVSGAGFNITNVLDYGKWVRAMMKQEGPMSKDGHKAVTAPRMAFDWGLPESMPTHFYGLGWIMTWYRGEYIVFHPGGLNGFAAYVMFIPSRNWGVITLGNTTSSTSAQEKLIWHLVDNLLSVPDGERFDWEEKSLMNTLKGREAFEGARQRLYPHSSNLPPCLPLEAYAGMYSHPAYQSITFVAQDEKLHAEVLARTWKFTLDLEHVSGEHFLAVMQSIENPGKGSDTATKAEFRIGPGGKAEKVLIAFESDCDMIEFDRVEEK